MEYSLHTEAKISILFRTSNIFSKFALIIQYIRAERPKPATTNIRIAMKRNIAVILAGGVGKRLGLSTPKQFFKVAGKMVVEHTVDVFERNRRVDEIAIVSNPYFVSEFENIVLRNGWKKVKRILKGGKERYDSSLAAIRAYADEDVNLIFHDAVRPLLTQRVLDDVIDALANYKAIDVAVPSADTIIEVDGDFISGIPDRSRLRRGQTPQAFDAATIRDAYAKALADPAFRTRPAHSPASRRARIKCSGA